MPLNPSESPCTLWRYLGLRNDSVSCESDSGEMVAGRGIRGECGVQWWRAGLHRLPGHQLITLHIFQIIRAPWLVRPPDQPQVVDFYRIRRREGVRVRRDGEEKVIWGGMKVMRKCGKSEGRCKGK